jgi:hypothetical protein
MASTYVNDLRLNELGTGDASGTWGNITNTNLELIGEGLSFGTQDCFSSDANATTTVADGATDPARSMYFKVTSSATLSTTRELTIAPNTISRLQYIENATTGSQSITIKQGSGATVTIPNGDTKVVYLDGAGSGAAVVDAMASLNVVDLKVQDDLTVTDDVSIGGLATVGGTLGVTGVLTANAGVVVDNITIDGTEIDLSSGDLTLDIASDLIIDVDDGRVFLKDGGTTFGRLANNSTNFDIVSVAQDKDIIFKGNDGGSEISALTLDMSDAGTATFNNNVILSDDSKIKLGDSGDLEIYHDGSHSYIDDTGTGDLILRGSSKVNISKYTGEAMIHANVDSSVDLFFDNVVKLSTASGGVSITGTCTATTFSGSGASLTNLPASGPFQSAPVTASTASTVSVGTSYTTVVQVAISHDANDKVLIFANFQLDTQSSSTSGQGDFRILATNTSQSAELNVNDILAESARLRWQEAYIARDSRGISAITTYYIQVRKTNGTMNVNHSQGTSTIMLFLETV